MCSTRRRVSRLALPAALSALLLAPAVPAAEQGQNKVVSDQFAAMVKSDYDRFGKLIKDANVKLEQ